MTAHVDIQASGPRLLEALSPGVVVDWGYGLIEAVASAAEIEEPPALTASMDARRTAVGLLREAVAMVRLDGSHLVHEFAEARPEAWDRLAAAAARAPIGAEWPDEEGRLLAAAQLPLWAGISSIAAALFPALTVPEVAPSTDVNVILRLDAQRLPDLEPVMYPKLRLEDGRELVVGDPYSVYPVLRPVIYTEPIDDQALIERWPDARILTLRITDSTGEPPADLVVPAAAAGVISEFIEAGRLKPDVQVVVVVYPPVF